jgi:hypothetical protein
MQAKNLCSSWLSMGHHSQLFFLILLYFFAVLGIAPAMPRLPYVSDRSCFGNRLLGGN